MKKLRLLAPFLIIALLGAACQQQTDDGAGDDGETRTVKIGFIAPITGPLAALGSGMRNSVQLAIDQANKADKIKGWKIEYVPKDDEADGQKGAARAQELASDPEMAAVIGTLNTSVALQVQPVLGPARIAMVSPANTGMPVTQGQNWTTDPKRPYDNYFRVVTNDRQQGTFAAKYAYETLAKKKAVTIHDKKAYGQGLAAIFTDQFKKSGGTILDALEINPGEGDYKTAITRAKAKNPDLIYYGGEYPEMGILAKNMAELALKPPGVILMGGDGVVDKKFVEIAGQEAAQGHYATLVGAGPDFLPAAKKFVDDYEAADFEEAYSAYGPQAFDTANVIITALAEVLPGKTKIDTAVRDEIIKAIQGIKYEGVIGTTSFDEYGDTSNKLLSVLKVEGPDFKALEAKRI